MGFPSDSTPRSSHLDRLNASARPSARRRLAPRVVRAAHKVCETLEPRRLLAVVNGGETALFYNGDDIFQIEVTGPGSFTFTAAIRAEEGGGLTLGEVPMDVYGRNADGSPFRYAGGFRDEKGDGPELPEFDIYSIYGWNTSDQTSMSITQLTETNNSRFANPYGGDAGDFDTNQDDTGADLPISVSPGNGGVFIGGRRRNGDDQPNVLAFALTKSAANVIATADGITLENGSRYKPGVYVYGTYGSKNIAASMNNLFIAGTITGQVEIKGSVNTFYAGNIITGDPTNGDVAGNGIGTQNFEVGGDLRNLIVSGGIGMVGGAPDAFRPGTDFVIGGRVQQIKAGGEIRATFDINGATSNMTDGSDVLELETRRANPNGAAIGNAFQNFQFVNQDFAGNDSFDSPQILGSYRSDSRELKGQVTVNGAINNGPRTNDAADYYGIPLMAGQTVDIQLNGLGSAYLGVYDPDGRLIATDRSNQNDAAFINQKIRITTTTAGLYRVAALPVTPEILSEFERPYQLTVDRLGDISVGGIVAGGDFNVTSDRFSQFQFSEASTGIRVRNNDLGAILVGGAFYGADNVDEFSSRNARLLNPIVTDQGNIRSLRAATISLAVPGGFAGLPNIKSKKSVGRIQATDFAYFNAFGQNLASNLQPSDDLTIGGDYQVIQAGGDLSAVLSANGGIGVIRAASVGQNLIGFPGYYEVDADGQGRDGYIGLIDVTGNFGTFRYGGPAISSGQGSSSNVRYMRVGGTVYRDFGAGAGQTNVIEVTDTSTTITDDSGAAITLTPIVGESFDNTPEEDDGTGVDPITGAPVSPIQTPTTPGGPIQTPDTTGGSDQPDERPRTASGRLIGGRLTVSTYPTRNGGSVIFRVVAQDPTGAARTIGVDVVTSGVGQGDIGEIISYGVDDASVIDDDPTDGGALPTLQTPLRQDDVYTQREVILSGRRTSVFEIRGIDGTTLTSLGDFTLIQNNTDGEIVNVRARDVATLEGEWIGLSRNANGLQLDGVADVNASANVYPFNQTKNAIVLQNALAILARGPVGNIIANDVQLLEANSDERNVRGTMEGIAAPVFAFASFRRVDIGEGLASSGAGEAALGGIYSNDTIGLVSNDNGFGDLRGDVIANNYIEGIRLRGGGSIVDSDILESGNVGDGSVPRNFFVGFETNSYLIDADTTLGLEGVGDIRVLGTGGIINTRVLAQNMGTTTVAPSGFGVLNSTFFSSGGGTMKGLIAGGLGIRSTNYTGGSFVGDVVATGGGELLDLNNFSTSVTGSLNNQFDPTSGVSYNAANDLFLFFTTSSAEGEIEGVTNSGIIADSSIIASRSISSVRAFDFRSFELSSLRPIDELFPNTINFADDIGAISAKRNINGLRIVGGNLGELSAGGSVSNTRIQVRSDVQNVVIKKNVLGTTSFNITDGYLDTFRVGGFMNGTISASEGIGTIIIDGDVRSAREQGGIYTPQSIGSIKISGNVRDGAYIRARRAIGSLTINGDFEAGAVVRATKFSKITIRGDDEGTIQRS